MSEEIKILIVEDYRIDREVLKLILGIEPFVVQVVEDGEIARDLVDTQAAVDIVVMDVNIPKFSGIDLTKHIRKNPQWSKVPVIALSSHMDAKTVITLNRSGASSILSKPYNPERLLKEILKLTGYERVDT